MSKLVLEAGEAMLVNGAETYRVEETMERIGSASGATEVDSFVTATGIFLSITDAYGETVSKIRRVRRIATDLAKVSQINDLSRRLTSKNISPEEAMAGLSVLKESPPSYKETGRTLSSGVGSACFALLFGGGPADVIPAFLGGLLVYSVVSFINRLSWTRFIAVMAGGAMAALVGTLANYAFSSVETDKVIVGNIMILVPGVALTNAIRDVMSGELVAGGSRFLEACVTAVSTAIGVALWLSTWKAVGGLW
jgi:uncharacterized membrane protein YjjP (DUF1212 family)